MQARPFLLPSRAIWLDARHLVAWRQVHAHSTLRGVQDKTVILPACEWLIRWICQCARLKLQSCLLPEDAVQPCAIGIHYPDRRRLFVNQGNSLLVWGEVNLMHNRGRNRHSHKQIERLT